MTRATIQALRQAMRGVDARRKMLPIIERAITVNNDLKSRGDSLAKTFFRHRRDFATLSLDHEQIRAQEKSLEKAFRTKLSDEDKRCNFLMSKASFECDFKNKKFIIANREETKKAFCKEFPVGMFNGKAEFDFLQFEMVILGTMNGHFKAYPKLSDTKVSFASPETASPKESKKKIFSYSEHRLMGLISQVKRSQGTPEYFASYVFEFCRDLIKQTTIESAIEKLGFKKEIYGRLSPDFTSTTDWSCFSRDDNVIIGNQIFHTDQKLVDERLGLHHSIFIPPNSFLGLAQKAQNIGLADALKSGLKVDNSMPFFVKGGNVVFDSKKNKVFLCVSEDYYDESSKGLSKIEFYKAMIVNENGDLEEISDYKKYCDFVKNWGEENGFEVEIIDRNTDKYSLNKIYHLDVFMNVVGDYLMIYKDAVTPETFSNLQDIYGDKIIEISQRDWVNLATNFISLDDKNIIFTSNEVSDELVKKLNERGINCALPSIFLGLHEGEDGLRCKTSELDTSRTPKIRGSKKLQEESQEIIYL